MNQSAFYQGYLQKDAAPDLKSKIGPWLLSALKKAKPTVKPPAGAAPFLDRATMKFGVPLGAGALVAGKEYERTGDLPYSLGAGAGMGLFASPTGWKGIHKAVKGSERPVSTLAYELMKQTGLKAAPPLMLGGSVSAYKTLKNLERGTGAGAEVAETAAAQVAEAAKTREKLNTALDAIAQAGTSAGSLASSGKDIASAAQKVPKAITSVGGMGIAAADRPSKALEGIARSTEGTLGKAETTMDELTKTLKKVREGGIGADFAAKTLPYLAAAGLLAAGGYGAMKHFQSKQEASTKKLETFQEMYPYLNMKELQKLVSGETKEWVMARRNRKRAALAQLKASGQPAVA